MARIRTIKPDFFRSRSLARCSIVARLTFIGLWCEADDHGRGICDARLLKAAIYPLDDDITTKVIERHLEELETTGHILIYTHAGDDFYFIHKWDKHQSAAYRRGDPIHPEPPSDLDIQEPHDQSCKKVRDARPIVLEGKGREGKGRDIRDPESGHIHVPDDFPDFWTRYPKRNGKKLGKANTERLWMRLSLSDRTAALKAVGNYADACDSGLTLPKDPERFIKGRCWDDWLEPAAIQPTKAVGGVLAGSVSFDDSYYGRSQR